MEIYDSKNDLIRILIFMVQKKDISVLEFIPLFLEDQPDIFEFHLTAQRINL